MHFGRRMPRVIKTITCTKRFHVVPESERDRMNAQAVRAGLSPSTSE
jgi:hypothetical protein